MPSFLHLRGQGLLLLPFHRGVRAALEEPHLRVGGVAPPQAQRFSRGGLQTGAIGHREFTPDSGPTSDLPNQTLGPHHLFYQDIGDPNTLQILRGPKLEPQRACCVNREYLMGGKLEK